MTERLATEHVITEQPATEQLATEQPVAEQPATEQPVAEKPSPEQPAAEKPSPEQVTPEQPDTGQSAAEQSVDTETHAAVARSTALMSIATLGSRITGLVRTWAMAFALGNSLVTSAYQVANNMPNVVFDLVAGGLLGAAFIPVFLLERNNKGPAGSNAFACNLLNLTIIVLGALSLLSSFFAPQLIATQTFTVGETDRVVELSVLFFRIFAFQIVFYGISGIITAVLNANRIYFMPALAPAINNICVIISFFAYIPLAATNAELALVVLGVGTTLGVVVQAAIQIPALIKMGFTWTPRVALRDPALIEALKIALPTMLYIVGTLVAFSCRNAFSLQVGDNGPSTLLYAWTWFQLPYGVVSVSLSRALFTEMGDASAQNDMQSMRELVQTGISGNVLLILPFAALMFVLASPIMELFQAGAFQADDVVSVATILSAWVVSLPFYAVLMFMYNAFAALRKFMRFAFVSTVMVVVQCLLYYLLCQNGMLGLFGVPVADFVYYALCCIILVVLLRSMIGSFGVGAILWRAVRVLIASVVAAGIAYLLSHALPVGAGMLAGFIRLVVCGGIGLVVAYGLCALFGIPEMHYVTDIVKKITSRLHRS